MNEPTFLIIGAQKAATTWLSDILRQHPQVCMPKEKELHFFNKTYNYEKGLAWYERQFSGCSDKKAYGEATPNYLWTNPCPEEIKASRRIRNIPEKVNSAYPDIKLIVTLRDPIDRAISAYRTHIRAGRVSPWQSIIDVAHQYGIVTMGDYETQILHWFEYFSPSQFHFLVFEEDIKINQEHTVRELFRFLDIDPTFTPKGIGQKRHPSLGPLYQTLLYYFPFVKPVIKTVLPDTWREKLPFRSIFKGKDVSPKERVQLKKYFSDFNHNLPELIDREPAWWSESIRHPND